MNLDLKNSAIRALVSRGNIKDVCFALETMSACYEPCKIQKDMENQPKNEKEQFLVDELLDWKNKLEDTLQQKNKK